MIDRDAPTTLAHSADLTSIRARLAARSGPRLWRGMEELAGDDSFFKKLRDEFAPGASEWFDATSRRNFLKLMGASMALAGMVGCNDQPQETIVPYVDPPEQVVPGKPTFYATAMPFTGYGLGVLAESHEGRPTKIEGNPAHPASLGATNVFMQASVLDLYDPDRSKLITHGGQTSAWGPFQSALMTHLGARRKDGAGVRLLTRAITSPTLSAQIDAFRKRYPASQWHVHEPGARAGCCGRSGGAPGQAVYDFSKADVVLSLDADFMITDVGSLAYARQFIDGRRRQPGLSPDRQPMNRLYVVESTFSLTGSMADHRKAVRPSQIIEVARVLASRLKPRGATSASASPAASAPSTASSSLPADVMRWIDVVAQDLSAPQDEPRPGQTQPAKGGVAVVVAGDHHPPELQAIAYAMNQALGSIGKAVRYIEPVEKQGGASIESLVADMRAGKVDTLLILGGNPVYDSASDIDFRHALEALTNARDGAGQPTAFTAHLASHEDETSFYCQWHVPESHYLEAWGDLLAFDGSASIVQPLILPLYASTRSAIEVMAAALGERDASGYQIVRARWQPFWSKHQGVGGGSAPTTQTEAGTNVGAGLAQGPQTQPTTQIALNPENPAAKNAEAFELWWEKTLRAGMVEGFTGKPRTAEGAAGNSPGTSPSTSNVPSSNPDDFEVVFRLDPGIWDGQFANNPWLMELPRPFTKLVWDNAALISYRTAERLQVMDGSVIELTYAGSAMNVPVLVVPGHPDNTLTLHLGFGRTRAGHVSNEGGKTVRGFNAYALQTAASPGFGGGARVRKTGDFTQLVLTRSHHGMAALPGVHVQTEEGRLKPRAVEHPGVDEQKEEVLNRKLVRTATLQQFRDDPIWATRLGGSVEMREKGYGEEKPYKGRKVSLTLFPGKDNGGWDYSKGYQWAMVIDQTACIGCNACVIACQAENNIPVVGKEECGRQREMHWIRIDDWYGTQPTEPRLEGVDAVDDPQVTHQPVPCMQCENAPCELVCPVGATTHSVEGINEMTYNRCIGTRYCSNNCPYKVRRFNFFLFADFNTPSRALQYNPDVSVRSRGVMEKCTYCVQRVNNTRMEIEKMALGLEERARQAESDGTPAGAAEAGRLREAVRRRQVELLGQLQTACQQSCPTQAIVFGDKNQPASHVSKLREDELEYGLLMDLTTRPRTTYLARISNFNPRLETSGGPA